ncbi:unnamed protein product [Sphenostylis stenocarpa]|uniref:SET domain-containing protein n=1 Tax=Sphenostylis stenocarpa TaxID=92480 RepID=A0AA87B822_9FABA|nr:unnamed protein product [Sphenostylis stenocarpa]
MSFRAGTGTASLRWLLHSVFNAHCLHLSFYSLALSKPQFSANCHDILPWLELKAASTISSSLSIGKSSYGRSLFASKSIQTGDCILKVPYRVQITADNLPPEIRYLIGEEVGNIAKLAIVILIEKKLGQGSEWYPYISCLPQQGELHNTLFWNESELEMIRPSSVYQETIDHKSQIEKDFLAVKRVFECCHLSFGDFTFKDFMHACTQVGSRAWGSTKGLALIPFADFLNHDGVSEAIVMSDDDKQCSEIIADRDYAPGEQVLIRYGKFSNATLMLDFGFTIPHNIYDQVQIQFDIAKHDPLHDMKLELWHRYAVLPPEDMKDLTYPVNTFVIKMILLCVSKLPLLLLNALLTFSKAKEVKSDRGKGKGLPQSIRALARVLSCTTSQELDDLVMEAAQNDGRLARRPLKDIRKEIKAHMMLLSVFIQLIEERNATIMSLDSSYSSSLCERLSVRRLMAQDLLQAIGVSEKYHDIRILTILHATFENIISTGKIKDGNNDMQINSCLSLASCDTVFDESSEGDHQKIYWLVKVDGVYHSWDNNTWQKRKSWQFTVFGATGSSNPVERDSRFGVKINILVISIVNDLRSGSPTPSFSSDYQPNEVELKPGSPFVKLMNFDSHSGMVKWAMCKLPVILYSSSIDGDHQRIYWSVREDGVYHSWDNTNWKSSASANSLAATHTDQNDSNVSVDINVVGIIISNDLPPSPNKLLLFTDFQKNQVEIRRGDPYTRLLSMDDHTGQLRWKQCLDFSYIPGLEKGHQRVFCSVCGECLESRSVDSGGLQKETNISADNINIVFVSVSNDLPRSPKKLFFFADFQKDQVEIRQGNPYTSLVSMDDDTGELKWNKCSDFSVYIPGLEKGHNTVYWSAREDGIYHSWDSKTWERKEVWSYFC